MTDIFSKYKAALIDMDGVLYDSMPGHTLAWHRMMSEAGVKCTREEFYLYEGMTGTATVNLLFSREFGHNCDEAKSRRLYDIKSRYFREMGQPRLMPDADRMLAALKEGGLERVLVTGSGQRSLLDNLDRDYPGMFGPSMRVTALDVQHGKPDPEPYLRGASKAGVSPSECIVIENAPLGVRAGKAAGCFTIAVTTGPIPREEFEKEGADMIFPSMSAFAEFLESGLAETAGVCVRLRAVLDAMDCDRVFYLTDANVRALIPFEWPDDADVHVLSPGEGSKTPDEAVAVWQWLTARGATRRSVLVNVGGGVVTDLGGFAASVFKRGIRHINVPTTLLGAVDAAIGGKTGIDFQGIKNQIGSFAMPAAVILEPSLFASLPRPEVLSGFAEVIKMMLLDNENLYRRLLEGDALEDKSLMDEAMKRAASCKEEIVALDPREQGLRRILNLGHTAGHAFESLAVEKGAPVSHGVAVAHGLLLSLALSARLVGLPVEETEIYRQSVLLRYYPPLPFGIESIEQLIELMAHDKKNNSKGEISFVLLSEIGVPVAAVEVSPEDVRQVLLLQLKNSTFASSS